MKRCCVGLRNLVGLMEHPADFQLLEADGRLKAELTGDWTSRTLGDAPDRVDMLMLFVDFRSKLER